DGGRVAAGLLLCGVERVPETVPVLEGPGVCGFDDEDVLAVSPADVIEVVGEFAHGPVPERVVGEPDDIEIHVLSHDAVEPPSVERVVPSMVEVEDDLDTLAGPERAADSIDPGLEQLGELGEVRIAGADLPVVPQDAGG